MEVRNVKIALACDHAGYPLKEEVKRFLLEGHHDVDDFGTASTTPVDYPDVIYPAALAVSEGRCERGILIDGAGYPSAALANKLFGVNAGVCNDLLSARLSREHSNTNVLCMGGKIIGSATALEIVNIWLTAEFLGGRYATRLEKVRRIEARHLKSPDLVPLKVVTLPDVKHALLNKRSLLITEETIITPSVLELAREIR
jgi:ribose 5-phosphate isomerase B